jgi:GntR family transcriptional regulator, transcriptional repressor for pyruvate dehydrogenase complex
MSHGARSALFAPLEQTGRADAVAERLADAITLGMLTDGEQLPSEAELAGRFGVATVTVREALVRLRKDGLVETRRGRGGGSFVRAPSNTARAWLPRLRALSLADLRDIGDHYLAVAGTAAKLAADRAGDEDLDRLRMATADLRAATGPAVARAERYFHLELAAAAQSPRLTQQEMRLQAEAGGLLWLPADDGSGAPHAHTEHAEITSAIARRDGELARALTEQHILSAIDRLTEEHLRLIEP